MLDPLKKPCCAITLTDYSKPNEENCQCFQPTSRFGWSAARLNKRKYYEWPRVIGRVCGPSLSPRGHVALLQNRRTCLIKGSVAMSTFFKRLVIFIKFAGLILCAYVQYIWLGSAWFHTTTKFDWPLITAVKNIFVIVLRWMSLSIPHKIDLFANYK